MRLWARCCNPSAVTARSAAARSSGSYETQNCPGGRSHPRGCARFPAETEKEKPLQRDPTEKDRTMKTWVTFHSMLDFTEGQRNNGQTKAVVPRQRDMDLDPDLKSTDSCQEQKRRAHRSTPSKCASELFWEKAGTAQIVLCIFIQCQWTCLAKSKLN